MNGQTCPPRAGLGARFATTTAMATVFALALALAPAPAAWAQNIQAWAPYQTYNAGDQVTYGGQTYTALQPHHQSLPSWTPPETPALWNPVNPKGAGACAAAPPSPTGLTSSNLTATGVTLRWVAPTPPANCALTGYTVLANGAAIGTTGDTTFSVGGMTAASTYAFTVQAKDVIGASPASAALNVTTPSSGGGTAGCAAPWQAAGVYTGGMTASSGGVSYKANWWTQGNDPATNSGPAGSGQPWTSLGACAPCSVAPAAPTGLQSFGATATSASLGWTAAAVPANCAISSYTVYKNGQPALVTTGTSATVPGLASSTSYSFTVAASDPVGVSGASAPVSVTTLAPGTVSTQATFAPYIDMSLTASQGLLDIQRASNIRTFTLAFILSSNGCSAGWGGGGSIGNDTLSNGATMLSLLRDLRAAGGDYIVSFGGANGTELAQACPTAASLQAAYQAVIDRYQVKSVDFDIEGGAVADTASLTRRAQALVGLKAANPGLVVSYTLPVLPTGLDYNGVAILKNLKQNGLDPDVINVMAMDYGASVDNGGRMGADATSAATNTALQISAAGLTSKVGITPMIGVNDTAGEVFQLADAQTVVDFAKANAYVGRLAMWSVSRDNGSCAGTNWASPTCSGLSQSPYAFSSIFQAR